jgi:hypothetical protein
LATGETVEIGNSGVQTACYDFFLGDNGDDGDGGNSLPKMDHSQKKQFSVSKRSY